MFENKPIISGTSVQAEGTALRAIAWSDLTARINAARDLRRVLRRDNACLMASFTDAAAGYFSSVDSRDRAGLTDLHHAGAEIDECDGKPTVNPDGLGHGKSAQHTDAGVQGEAVEGDREIR